jgi:hypothetical protein
MLPRVKGNPFRPLRPLPLIAIYAVMLHWTYQTQIAPAFYYLGSRYRDPDMVSYAFAGVMVLILSWAMPYQLRRVSDFVLWVLFVMAAIPCILVPQYADILDRDRSLVLAAMVAGNFLLVTVLTRLSPAAIHLRFKVEPSLLWTGVLVVSLGFYGYLLMTTGLQFRAFGNLGDARAIRFEYRDHITSAGPILGYLVRLQGNVLNPLLVAKGIYSRRWWMAGAGTFGQLLIFSLTGYKITLLSAVALLVLAVMFARSNTRNGSLVLWGITALSLVSLAVDRARGQLMLTELFVDRLILVPGTLTAAHVLVFDPLEKMRWSYSIMSPFFDNPYGTTPAYIVGAQFSGQAGTTANANLFADGFANLGWSGITIEALLLVVLLWLLDGASRHLPLPVACCILLVPAQALVNGSVLTSILSGGIGAAIAVMAVLPEDGWGQGSKPPLPDRERQKALPRA